MKKFTFNFGFLERFRKPKHTDSVNSNEVIHESHDNLPSTSEFDSEVSAEDFAEKTLNGFNIKKYQEELRIAAKASEEKKNDPNQQSDQSIVSTNTQFQFEEMPFPKADDVSKKFKLKFPKFNRQDATNRIKASLAGKSPLNRLGKYNWNDFVLRLFSPYTRGKVHAVFIIFFVVVATYMLGKNIALFMSSSAPITKTSRSTIPIPLERTDSTLQDINKITSINLFNAKESDKSSDTSPKKDIESIICLDANKPTSLQIKLLDTIVLQDSVKSVASVQVRGSSELMNVREGERLEEMAEVSKINRMKLILKNLQTGDCEYAMPDAEAEPEMPNLKIVSAKAGKSLFKSINPNIKNTGNNFKIKRAFRDSMINNMSDVLTQAKAIQITNPDGSLSFKMTEVVPGSIYSMLDIQENDIIDSINGKKIENLNDLMGYLGKIKEIDHIQVGSKRNGMAENKDFNFEE